MMKGIENYIRSININIDHKVSREHFIININNLSSIKLSEKKQNLKINNQYFAKKMYDYEDNQYNIDIFTRLELQNKLLDTIHSMKNSDDIIDHIMSTDTTNNEFNEIYSICGYIKLYTAEELKEHIMKNKINVKVDFFSEVTIADQLLQQI